MVVLLSLVVLAVYVTWIAGPYLRSIIVRDAAVTSWINPLTAPIDGYVGPDILRAGDRVGADELVGTIEFTDADATAIAQARAALEAAKGRQAALTQLVEDLDKVVAERRAQLAAFAAAFNQDLDARILAANNNIALIRSRLVLEKAQAERLDTLAASGTASLASADAANAQALEYERSLEDMQSVISRATLRRTAAGVGVFLLEDGTDAGDAVRDLDDSIVALHQAKAELAAMNSEVVAAREVVNAAIASYRRALMTPVLAPPNAMIWSLISAPGQTVRAGTPIAMWVDCSVMLIDVPVSDVELALLRRGGAADVLLDGGSLTRDGTILLIRGSAATLGRDDLAALAKGRTTGVGQVLVSLAPTPEDIELCPIGLAAYVDFPGIGLLDVLRARLRL